MLLLLLLLLLSSAASAAFCSSSAELLNVSFALCKSDPACDYNFHTDSFAYFSYLLNTELLRPPSLNWSVVCDSSPPLWLALMRDHRFCTTNQVLSADGRCLCLPERNCAPKEPASFDTAPLAKSSFMVVTCAVVIYGTYKVTKEVRENARKP